MKVLYLDLNVYYVSPTRTLIPSLLKHQFDLTIYGPGFVDTKTLHKGVAKFVELNGPYDFIMASHHVVLTGGSFYKQPNVVRSYFRDSFVSRFDLGLLEHAMPDMFTYFKASKNPKIAILLETDFYCVTNDLLDGLTQSNCYIFSRGTEFVKSLEELPKLKHETFADKANDNWKDFVTDNRNRVISTLHFVGNEEFSFNDIRNRAYTIDVPGVNYLARIDAYKRLESAGFHGPAKHYRKVFSVAAWSGYSLYKNYSGLNLYQSLFRNNIESSKYAYTCGSGLEYPVRKFFEIPALGTVLICMPCAGFEDLGFEDRKNAMIAEPDQVVNVVRELERNPELASEIARRGRDLVWEKHSVYARSIQLKLACESIQGEKFNGAYWDKGEFRIKER
jgi:hypothetical protein